MNECDFLIIGAGIAGASLAYHLAPSGRVVLLERESQPGYHSTGRSAAVFTENYGPHLMRVMTKLSAPFLHEPQDGFSANPILSPLGVLLIAREDQLDFLDESVKEFARVSDDIHKVDAQETLALAPCVRPDYAAGGAYEESAMAIDVHALHMGYLANARAAGVQLVTDAEVMALTPSMEGWTVATRNGSFRTGVVVNAAGAWADVVGEMAGAVPIGLSAKRRTAITFDAPKDAVLSDWCAVIDCEEQWYIKPESGQVLGSPADATPVPPQDVQPDEWDIAMAVDRIQKATTLEVNRINRRWAGLRSFVADGCPVVGFAPERDGFFWLAGQGGYGIQTSFALGETAASLLLGTGLPSQVSDYGITEADLGPVRLRS